MTTTHLPASGSPPNFPSSSNAPPSTSQSASFVFPPHYSFPPFFTLQRIAATRLSQLQSWSSLIQSYAQHHHIFTLSLSAALQTPLFRNAKLNRQLSLRDARDVIEWMTSSEGGGRAEWIHASSSSKDKTDAADSSNKDKFYVFYHTPAEWASIIEDWVDATGQKGTVLTLYELVESDATRREEFHGMEEELLKRCLAVCVKRGKAQVFGGSKDDSSGMGVKFF